MTRWHLVLEYDGAAFSGWQRQSAAFSVQQALEDALFKFCGETITVHVAGRTDAGVHGLGQAAHVDIERACRPHEVMSALNYHLKPHPCVVLSAKAVAADFHARFDAKQRHYVYRILNRRAPSALLAQRVWHVPKKLDIAAMQLAANSLLGTHDFTSFRAAECQAKSPIKTLEQFTFQTEGEQIIAHISARSFLYKQVRNMIGTLVEIGMGRRDANSIPAILAARERDKAGQTAPPDGLYFLRVDY